MRRLALALVSVMLLACGQDSATVGPNGPQFDWMNNPDNGNLRISRWGASDFAVSWTDPTTGLRATHTTFPLTTGCGPQEVLDPLDAQNIGLEDFTDFLLSWQHSQAKGELWIMVRDLNQVGTCAGNALIAEGMGTIHYIDNDVFAFYPEGGSIRQNDNAWAYIAQGALTSVTGGTMQYSGSWRAAWDPQGGDIHVEKAQVTLH